MWKNFVGFLGYEKARLFAFEIYWPLDTFSRFRPTEPLMSFLWVDIFLTTLVTENDTDLLKIPSFLLRLLQYTVPSVFFGGTKYIFFLSFWNISVKNIKKSNFAQKYGGKKWGIVLQKILHSKTWSNCSSLQHCAIIPVLIPSPAIH